MCVTDIWRRKRVELPQIETIEQNRLLLVFVMDDLSNLYFFFVCALRGNNDPRRANYFMKRII